MIVSPLAARRAISARSAFVSFVTSSFTERADPAEDPASLGRDPLARMLSVTRFSAAAAVDFMISLWISSMWTTR